MPYSTERLWRLPLNDSYQNKGILYQTNGQGFRIMSNNYSNEQSILFLGDSSTYGFGVKSEESFANLVGECSSLNVLNAGTPGYSSLQSKIQLKSILEDTEHDVSIVIIANLWSDMMSAPTTDSHRIQMSNQIARINQIVSSKMHQWSPTIRLMSAIHFGTNAVETIPINNILNASESGKEMRVSAGQYSVNLTEMVQSIQSMGAQPLLVLLPTNNSTPSKKQQTPYRSAAAEVAAHHGIIVVDFDQIELSKDIFLDIVHPNRKGHSEIAQEICDLLK